MRIILVAAFMVALLSCKKNVTNPPPENEHDAINSVYLVFRQGNTVTGTFVAEDPDGDGGLPPTRLDTIRLQVNQTYNVEIGIRNITNSASNDITPAVREEGVDHEFFFQPQNISLNIVKTDRDENNLPIGITSNWTTTATGVGNVLVKLMHKPGIKAQGDSDSKGSTDLALEFPVKVL